MAQEGDGDANITSARGTTPKGLTEGLGELEIKVQVKTIQPTALSKSVRILEESWRLEETCCHSNPVKKHQLTLLWKNLKGV